MKIEYLNDKCTGCGACYNTCVKKCILMRADDEGFLKPVIDHSECVVCGECDKKCPAIKRGHLDEIKNVTAVPLYVAFSNDCAVVENSSSGGLFIEFAKYIIGQRNGVVYGAAFDSAFHVKHIRISQMKEIERLSGSKYVQSDIGRVYQDVKKDLDSDITVLFSGCGCQIAGLKSYLEKDFSNLYTIALVCHGVPSPGVWDDYISHFKNVNTVSFRDTFNGDWKNYRFSITTTKKKYTWKEKDNPYTLAFVKDTIVRKCCYSCKFKSHRCSADLMIGDAWGVEKFCPKLYNDHGTSLIIVYTDIGQELFESIREQLTVERVSTIEPYVYNPRIIQSIKYQDSRKIFSKLNRIFTYRHSLLILSKVKNEN